jgi:hypothetical protein
MKSITRLAIATTLLLTSAFTSPQLSAAPVATVIVARNSALPTPMCAPDDPNACGMARGRK